MEAFSLLKYWRGGAANSSSAAAAISDDTDFFDLELSVPVETDSPTGSDQNELKLEPVSPLEELSEPVHNGFSRLKSATNFRVLLLKLKKNGEKTAKQKTGKSSGSSNNNNSNKFLTIKLKIEEIPIRSVFKRDNSSKTRTNERRVFSKDVNVMQRYLKMVSKRYGGERKGEAEEGGKRRDDSLVQQQDGIQSAILHCKRSFNSSRDAEMSVLSRSVSDPSHDHHKSMNMAKKCSEELKEIGF